MGADITAVIAVIVGVVVLLLCFLLRCCWKTTNGSSSSQRRSIYNLPWLQQAFGSKSQSQAQSQAQQTALAPTRAVTGTYAADPDGNAILTRPSHPQSPPPTVPVPIYTDLPPQFTSSTQWNRSGFSRPSPTNTTSTTLRGRAQSDEEKKQQERNRRVNEIIDILPLFEAGPEIAMDRCPICLEPLGSFPVAMGSCMHAVHVACITSSLAHSTDDQCPLCRAQLIP